MRVVWLVPILSASLLVACSAGSASNTPAGQPVWETPQRVIVSVGHSPRSTDPSPRPGYVSPAIDLRRVVLHSGPQGVVATFTTYSPMRVAWMRLSNACGQVGIYLPGQHLKMSTSSSPETEQGETVVAHSQVGVQFVSRRVVRLKAPLAAFGSRFSPTEPWLGYSLGYNCPPGDQQEDETNLVTPGA